MNPSGLTDWLVSTYGQEQMLPDPGFTRLKMALGDDLEFLQSKKIVTIAGTNGKGETTLRLSRYLKDHSQAVWISPHILRITERFSDEEGEIEFEQLRDLVHKTHARLQVKLSYYEFLFVVFCAWAREKNPEYLLLEVGLGGRLDAVNVFDADLVLLPSISRDHQEFLGNRYDQILREKLGLLRKETVLLSFLSLRYLREKTRAIVGEGEWLDLEDVSELSPSAFSERNDLLAYAANLYLRGNKLGEGLKNWSFSGEFLEHRGEVVRGKNEFVFFGSHNVDGMRKLVQFLQSGNYNFRRPPFDAVIVAFSRRDEADLRVLVKMIRESRLGNVIVTTFPHPKAADAEIIRKLAQQEGLSFAQDPRTLIDQLAQGQSVLVTGSYYFLGHLKSFLRSR